MNTLIIMTGIVLCCAILVAPTMYREIARHHDLQKEVEKLRKDYEKFTDACCNDIINNGHYSAQAVLNTLANLHATVGTQAIIDGRLGMDDFLMGFYQIVSNTYRYQFEAKDKMDIENAINQLKASANLK